MDLRRLPARLRRWFRLPWVILGEVGAITLACVLMTLLPQTPDASDLEHTRFVHEWPTLAALAQATGLDHVARAPWFLGLVGMALISLGIVLQEQARVLLATWRRPLTEASLLRAPLHAEFERPTRPGARTILKRTGWLGHTGSPLLHLGLVLCILGGLGRMLLGRDGVVDLVQGETLTAQKAAWGREWGGPLSQPLRLQESLKFEALHDKRYPSGDIQTLTATLLLGGARRTELAVNAPLEMGDTTLYLTLDGGPALLAEVGGAEVQEPTALMLKPAGPDQAEWNGTLQGIELHLQANVPKDGKLATQVEARVLVDGGLRYEGKLARGQGVKLGEGRRVVVRDIRPWVRMRARRDDALWVAWLGLGCGVLGALLIFGVAPVEQMVRVQDLGGVQRVTVALRPLRFAPLYRDRFQAIVRAEGGEDRADGGPA